MKQTSAREWKVGDLGRTACGETVKVVEVVSGRYLKCSPDSYGRIVYIPAHGEIEKVAEVLT